jgi:hypothetical protein
MSDLIDRIADVLMTELALDGTTDERDWAARVAAAVVDLLIDLAGTGRRNMTAIDLKTTHRTTCNGMPYTGKSYERPGFYAAVVVGDIESSLIKVDDLMTFYPREVREIAAALNELADWMEADPNAT